MMRFSSGILSIAAFYIGVTSLSADDWPQWRGPNRDGVWHQEHPLQTLPAKLTPRWSQPIGGGYAGIAVTGGRVYTMDRQTTPREVERVLCLDATTGQKLWTHDYAVDYAKHDRLGGYGNGPRATPTVHDGRVYTFGGVGHLHCFDAKTGQVLWSRDTVKDWNASLPTWGHSCSPLVVEHRLIVQIGAQPNGCLAALDIATGKLLWQSVSDPPGYSSPVLIQVGKTRELVYWTPEHVLALNPESGKVYWQVPYKVTYNVSITDPIWHDQVLLISGYWEGSKAIQLERPDKASVLWEGKRLCQLMATPLYRDGHVYALDKKDGLKCIELRTGKIKWEGEHITPKGHNPQVSLVWVGDRALILNELGDLILARLSPEKYQQLGKAKVIAGGTWAHPAFADDCIFARNDKEIVCVPLKP